jgi:glycosyltransferase involved in cell wall biosynthesis
MVLDHLMPDAQFFVYSNRPIVMPVSSERWSHINDPSLLMRRLPGTLWYLERASALVRRDAIDVFWGTANFLPRRLNDHARTILTVLDLVPQLFAQTIGLKHRLVHKLYFGASLSKANCVVTISQGTKRRLVQRYGQDITEVIYPCVNERFKRQHDSAIERVRVKYGLKQTFLLTVATLEPRKNLIAVLQAMSYLIGKGLDMPALVLVGQIGWKNKALFETINQAQSAGIRVVQTGFVPDEDLPALYGAAMAFIFPSLYEGFGMPVLEALHCGARVLASDTPEIREAGGDGVTYFEPTVEGIVNALEALLQPATQVKPDLHPSLGRLAHASTWEQEGLKLAELIRSLT